MADPRSEHRRAVARVAEDFLAGTVSFMEFVDVLDEGDYHDPILEDLVDRIEHFPQRGGLFGLHPLEHDAYVAETRRLVHSILSE